MKCTKELRLSYTEKAASIVASMSLEEKVDLMSGKVNFGPEQVAEMAKDSTKHYNHVPYPNAENKRLGVPSMRFCDGPRVVVCGTGKSTPVFPFLCSGGPPSIPRWKKK